MKFLIPFLLILPIMISCKKKPHIVILPKSYYTMKSTPLGKANFFKESRSVTTIAANDEALWVGTNHGIIQFDQNFKVKQIMTKNDGLPSDHIYAMVWDNDTLFAATKNGLALYSGQTWQNKKLPNSSKINTMMQSPKGGIWIGTSSELLYYAYGRFSSYKKNINVSTLKPTPKGGVWVGTKSSGFYYCFQGACKKVDIGLKSIIAMDKIEDNFWVSGVNSSGEYKLVLRNDSLYSYSLKQPIDWIQTFKSKILFYSGGRVFNIVTCNERSSKGRKLNADGGAPCYFANFNPTKFPPKMNIVRSFGKYLWVGTGSMGVGRYDGTNIFYYSSENLVSPNAHSLALSCRPDGEKCWFAAGKNSFSYTDKDGFQLLKPLGDKWFFSHFLTDFSGNTVGIAKTDDGKITFFRKTNANTWKKIHKDMVLDSKKSDVYVNFSHFTKSYIAWLGIGSKNKPSGIYVFNFKTGRIYTPKNYNNTKGNSVSIPVSSKKMSMRFGHRYLASNEGVIHLWRSGRKKFITKQGETAGLGSDIINDVVMDKAGSLWAGTDLGLCIHKESGWKCGDNSILPESGAIVAIEYNEKSDTMYVASESTIYKIKGRKIVKLSALEDLMDSKIRDIKLDSGGRLWVLQPSGLSVLYISGNPRFNNQ